ncbi:MAG: hypothetical protein CBC24_03295 [Candidatus Pelagibacter sp. TMED64]|nr:histidine kinase [Candidatus Pelagibacter sp.]OUU66367.1 MAG: hypothetical protein CBC24_03295 [Candidatus Pelagibacter sp. TMED64]
MKAKMMKSNNNYSWRFDKRERKYVEQVLKSGFVSSTSGNMNSKLEDAFAKRFKSKFAITFNSGTTTLHAALEAFGVGYGDEVIVSPLTVISCMNAILYCNAIPVFADIDENSFLIDPKQIEKKITSKTKAILPVHLYGKVCNMTEIMKIAKKHKLFVLEDSAQCFLGTHKGKYAGTFGNASSWSFENSKHLTTGDGGILTCNNRILGGKIRKFSTQGFRNATAKSGKIRISKNLFQDPQYKRHDQFGYMYRLPEIAAAVGLAQVEKIDLFVRKRIKMAKMYEEVIKTTNCKWLIPQIKTKTDTNAYWSYAVKFENKRISWYDFRKKYMYFGGDGIFAAWSLCYNEDSIKDIKKRLRMIRLHKRFKVKKGLCPVAEKVQLKIMQFTCNQKDEKEMRKQAQALYKTIKYFS